MANPVRRLLPRSLDPRQNTGEPTFEADVAVDDPAAPGEDPGTYQVTMPGGQTIRRTRSRRFVGLAPPPPSPQYRADPRYAARHDYPADTRQRAIANHRAWEERHGQATNAVNAWLAAQGLFGDEGAAAYTAYARSNASRQAARAAVAAAKTALAQAQEDLDAAAVTSLQSERGEPPTGADVVAARQAVEAAEAAAPAVDKACDQAFQRWGRTLVRVNYSEVLKGCGALEGPDAERATTWLRAKVYPPPGPLDDPVAWY